jgi:hypothetical protein
MAIKVKVSVVLLAVALVINIIEMSIINNYLMSKEGWSSIPLAGIPWAFSMVLIVAAIGLVLWNK